MKKLIYLSLTILLVSFTNGNSGILIPESIFDADNPVYIADNGITIKAKEWAKTGATGTIEGLIYTVVDEEMLREILANEKDVSTIATTKVTDMSAMFYGATSFNQDLSAWDFDTVTDCAKFSYDTPQWSMQKPVFTNCKP